MCQSVTQHLVDAPHTVQQTFATYVWKRESKHLLGWRTAASITSCSPTAPPFCRGTALCGGRRRLRPPCLTEAVVKTQLCIHVKWSLFSSEAVTVPGSGLSVSAALPRRHLDPDSWSDMSVAWKADGSSEKMKTGRFSRAVLNQNDVLQMVFTRDFIPGL